MDRQRLHRHRSGSGRLNLFLTLFLLAAAGLTSPPVMGAARLPVQAQAAQPAPVAPGVPFTPQQLSAMLPDSVYFQGKSAPLQLRNAGGASLEGAIVWVALVDSSGYSSGVQEKYQFYLVTEGPLHFGEATLSAGAYGGGFLGDRFILMDLGGHTVGEGPTQLDTSLRRPRPLQVLPDATSSVKLYLGRRWVLLRSSK